jgi:hypothetical protein
MILRPPHQVLRTQRSADAGTKHLPKSRSGKRAKAERDKKRLSVHAPLREGVTLSAVDARTSGAARTSPRSGTTTRTARSTLTRPPRHSRAAACPAAARRRRRRRPRGPGGCPILNRVDRRVIKQILGANYWLIGDRSRNAGGQARVVTSDTAQVSASAARRVGGTTASWVAQGIVR